MNKENLKTNAETYALTALGAAHGFYEYYASPMIQDATKAITAATKMLIENLVQREEDGKDT